jgi:hypothetical protein
LKPTKPVLIVEPTIFVFNKPVAVVDPGIPVDLSPSNLNLNTASLN